MSILPPKINLDSPRYDQSTYWGRAKHFFLTTNPLNLLASPAQMEAAKETVEKYKKGELTDISEDDLWAAKQLLDSAYHPETGETSSLSPSPPGSVTVNCQERKCSCPAGCLPRSRST